MAAFDPVPSVHSDLRQPNVFSIPKLHKVIKGLGVFMLNYTTSTEVQQRRILNTIEFASLKAALAGC